MTDCKSCDELRAEVTDLEVECGKRDAAYAELLSRLSAAEAELAHLQEIFDAYAGEPLEKAIADRDRLKATVERVGLYREYLGGAISMLSVEAAGDEPHAEQAQLIVDGLRCIRAAIADEPEGGGGARDFCPCCDDADGKPGECTCDRAGRGGR